MVIVDNGGMICNRCKEKKDVVLQEGDFKLCKECMGILQNNLKELLDLWSETIRNRYRH